MRQEELSSEMGHTPVLYQYSAMPTPRRILPVWGLEYSAYSRSKSVALAPASMQARKLSLQFTFLEYSSR